MQKVINVLALASFAVSASVVGAGAFLYVNRDSIRENIKSQITEGVAGALRERLGTLGELGDGSPAAPSAGGVVPGVSLPF